MVATRRSLGGHPSPAATSPPAAAASAPSQLSRAQQAALKKLDIAGTDALKGDTKAAQAAKAAVQTYHYRGAVYAADANTPSSWIENQPKRYLKRSRGSPSDAGEGGEGSVAVSEERSEDEEDEDEDEEEEIRQPAKKKSRHSIPHQARNHKPFSQTAASSRGKGRAVRGGRQSLPAKKKKKAEIDDNTDNDNMEEFDYAVSGGQDDRACLPRTPNWLPESASARKDRLSHRANPVPSTRSPIPSGRAMIDDIQRRKQEAARKKYQVQPLGEDDILSEKDLARVALVRLARKQREINEKMIEWKMAKELLELKKREAGLKAAGRDAVDSVAPEQYTRQPTTDLNNYGKGDDHEIGEQWDREREQNRTVGNNKSKPHNINTEPGIPESSPTAHPEIPHLSNATYHPFTKPGASRPSTPFSTTTTTTTQALLKPTKTSPYSSKQNHPSTTTPQPNPATPTSNTKPTTTTTTNNPTTSPPKSQQKDSSFTSLPPNGPLPTYSAGGDPLRWTIHRRRSSVDFATGEERAEYAIDVARLEGESKSAKARRVRRERAVVESWGGVVVDFDGSGDGGREVGGKGD